MLGVGREEFMGREKRRIRWAVILDLGFMDNECLLISMKLVYVLNC